MRHRVLVICLFQLRHCTILNKPFMNRLSGLFHKELIFLWNRPESLLLTMVQYLSSNQLIPNY